MRDDALASHFLPGLEPFVGRVTKARARSNGPCPALRLPLTSPCCSGGCSEISPLRIAPRPGRRNRSGVSQSRRSRRRAQGAFWGRASRGKCPRPARGAPGGRPEGGGERPFPVSRKAPPEGHAYSAAQRRLGIRKVGLYTFLLRHFAPTSGTISATVATNLGSPDSRT